MPTDNYPILSWALNLISFSTLAAFFNGMLPAVATIVTILFLSIQLYQTHVVQKILRARRLKKIKRLQRKLKMFEEIEVEYKAKETNSFHL